MATMCSAQAQPNGETLKSTEFFIANQPNNIYNLFTSQMKGAIKTEGKKQLLGHLKS